MEQQPLHRGQETSASIVRQQAWWIRFCGWLWKFMLGLGSLFIGGAIASLIATWASTPTNQFPAPNTPLSQLEANWPFWLILGFCLLLFALLIGSLGRWQTQTQILTMHQVPTLQERQQCLHKLLNEYQSIRQASLENMFPMELSLKEQFGAVEHAATLLFHPPSGTARPFPVGTTIRQIYDKFPQLLVLGAPGAGKSTLLVELAEQLTSSAQKDTTLPMPVLLPLSSWGQKKLPLQEWMSEQFAHLYTLPLELCKQWIQNGQILPLLDGLDEMKDQIACILAINAYQRIHLGPLIVSSRTETYEYASQTERLTLSNAVEVQPLTDTQIDEALVSAGKSLVSLHAELKRNKTLRELATSPLFLSVLQFTYHDKSVRLLPNKREDLKREIWQNFLDRVFVLKGGSAKYTQQESYQWLKWLAQQMKKHNQPLFGLEDIQPDWLSQKARFAYRWSVILGSGLFGGLLIGLFGRLYLGEPSSDSLAARLIRLFAERSTESPLEQVARFLIEPNVAWSIIGLVCALLIGTICSQIKSIGLVETIDWSKPTNVVALLPGFVGAGIFGALMGFLAWLYAGWLSGWLSGIICVLSAAFIIWILSGVSIKKLTDRRDLVPSKGAYHSAQLGLIFALIFIICGIIVSVIEHSSDMLYIVFCAGVIIGLPTGLGGALQHFVLLFWVEQTNCLPANSPRFLEDMRHQIILRRVGGSYQFFHSLLQDYFAELK